VVTPHRHSQLVVALRYEVIDRPWMGGTLTTRERADITGSGRSPNSVQSFISIPPLVAYRTVTPHRRAESSLL
jgi:hypothetical protein